MEVAKKQVKQNEDPYYLREKQRYENPIPSREFILEVLFLWYQIVSICSQSFQFLSLFVANVTPEILSNPDCNEPMITNRKGNHMSLVDIQVIEGTLSEPEKARMIEDITDAMVRIEGEPMRGVTWVRIHETAEGYWGIGGKRPMDKDHHRRRRR